MLRIAETLRSEAAQTMSEYTVVLAALTLGVLATLGLLSESARELLVRTAERLP